MNDKWIIKRTFKLRIEDGDVLEIEAGIHDLGSNPYFSVTGSLTSRGDAEAHSCGCIHDTILETMPALAPIVALHLSDEDGVPMHAVANAWYTLGRKGAIGKHGYLASTLAFKVHQLYEQHGDIPGAAEYLRISKDVLRAALFNGEFDVDNAVGNGRPSETKFAAWIEANLMPQWKAEALAGICLLKTMPEPAGAADLGDTRSELEQVCDKLGVKFEIEMSGKAPPPQFRDANAWAVKVILGRRSTTIDYYTGSAITEEPRGVDVLGNSLRDWRDAENEGSVEEWARSLGFNDMKAAAKMYNAIMRQAKEIKRVFGDAWGDVENARHS